MAFIRFYIDEKRHAALGIIWQLNIIDTSDTTWKTFIYRRLTKWLTIKIRKILMIRKKRTILEIWTFLMSLMFRIFCLMSFHTSNDVQYQNHLALYLTVEGCRPSSIVHKNNITTAIWNVCSSIVCELIAYFDCVNALSNTHTHSSILALNEWIKKFLQQTVVEYIWWNSNDIWEHNQER